MKLQYTILPLIIVLISVGMSKNLLSQRFAERNTLIIPLADSTNSFENDELSFAHSLSAIVGFSKYTGMTNNEHEWQQEIGAIAELIRFSNKSTLAAVAYIEFIADPNNNINFNPRAIFWEEGIFYMQKFNNSFFRTGYYHRCKHDIDNLDDGEERTLIYGSIINEMLYPIESSFFDEIFISAKNDIYTILQDDREPLQTNLKWDLNRLITSFNFKLYTLKKFSNGKTGLHAKAYLQSNIFSEHSGFLKRFTKINDANYYGGLTVGFAIIGNAMFSINLNYEYLQDTSISIEPQHAHLLSIGLRVTNPMVVK